MDPKENIDTEHLTVTGQKAEHVEFKGDVLIIVTQAYGPTGESLVGVGDVVFDGYPAVTVKVKSGTHEGLVHLSPFHGDRRKSGMDDLPIGSKCDLYCPVSNEPLDKVGDDPKTGATYYALYLTPALSEGAMVALSNIWGDYNSRIIDDFELISMWANAEEDID